MNENNLKYICLLEEDINDCPYYIVNEKKCSNQNTHCSFRKNENSFEQSSYGTREYWWKKYCK